MIQANFGYVENSSTSQADDDRKEITSFFMIARVPAENFDKTVEDLTALGRVTREDITAQDITDTYESGCQAPKQGEPGIAAPPDNG